MFSVHTICLQNIETKIKFWKRQENWIFYIIYCTCNSEKDKRIEYFILYIVHVIVWIKYERTTKSVIKKWLLPGA